MSGGARKSATRSSFSCLGEPRLFIIYDHLLLYLATVMRLELGQIPVVYMAGRRRYISMKMHFH